MNASSEKRPDDQLIEETLAGDTTAFGELVKKYQERLYNALLQVVGDPTETEDVVQDSFLQAFSKLTSFRRDSAFFTWLYRIAFNAAVSRHRRKRPTLSVEHGRNEFGEEPIDPVESPEARIERDERAAELTRALNRISEEHRMILVLREMEGMDYEAISKILDLPIGTVRSRLHRARVQLRSELERIES